MTEPVVDAAKPTTGETATEPAAKTVLGGDPATGGAGVQPNDPGTAKNGDAGSASETKTDAPVIPDKYEFTKPEKWNGDDADVAALEAQAKALGLTQEQFNKLAAHQVEQNAAQIEAYKREHAQKIKDWEAESRNHPELGKGKFDQTAVVASKAVQWVDRVIGSPLDVDGKQVGRLTAMLNETGFGSHPLFFEVFARIGQAMSEGKLVEGEPTKPELSRADRMYQKTTPG